jgi:hypothetical protein
LLFVIAALGATFVLLPSLQHATATRHIDSWLRMMNTGTSQEHLDRIYLFFDDSVQLGFATHGIGIQSQHSVPKMSYPEFLPLIGPVNVWFPIVDRPLYASAVLLTTLLGSLLILGAGPSVTLKILQHADATLAWRDPPGTFHAAEIRRRAERAAFLLFLLLSPLIAWGVWRATAGFQAMSIFRPTVVAPTWAQVVGLLLAFGLTKLILEIAFSMALARRTLSPDQRALARACARCGYNIQSLPLCPECGRPPASSRIVLVRRVLLPSVVLALLIGSASRVALLTEPRYNDGYFPPPAWHLGRAVREVLRLPQPTDERYVVVEPRLVLDMRSGSAEAVMVVRRGVAPNGLPSDPSDYTTGGASAAVGVGIALRARPTDPWEIHIVDYDDQSPQYLSYLVYTDGTLQMNHAEAWRDGVWFLINMNQFRSDTASESSPLPILHMVGVPDHVEQSPTGLLDLTIAAELRQRLDATLREAGYEPVDEPPRLPLGRSTLRADP